MTCPLSHKDSAQEQGIKTATWIKSARFACLCACCARRTFRQMNTLRMPQVKILLPIKSVIDCSSPSLPTVAEMDGVSQLLCKRRQLISPLCNTPPALFPPWLQRRVQVSPMKQESGMGLEPMRHTCVGVSGVEKRCLGFSVISQTSRTAVPWQLYARRDVFTPCVYPGSI